MPVSLDEAIRLHGAGRLSEAEAAYRALLLEQPRNGEALHFLGFLRFQAGDPDQAVALIGQALAVDVNSTGAHFHRGIVFSALGRWAEALSSLNRVLALKPDFARALNVRSEVFRAMGRTDEAMADIERSLSIDPRQPLALNNRASMLLDMGRLAEAVETLDRALALTPDLVPALCNRGAALRGLQRLEEAGADFARALVLAPETGQAASEYFYISALLCDWTERDRVVTDFTRRIAQDQKLHPWQVLIGIDDPALQLQAAKHYAPPVQKPVAARSSARHERLRIAYLSADFREHATGFQMVELFERHDKARFETFGVSLTVAEDSALRQRLKRGFDHFMEAGEYSDARIAALLSEVGIDIAVDLSGYISGARPGVFALRPAPIAVNYYGYPGTLGSDAMDYIIADPHIVPDGSEGFYAERVVCLPDCYYPTDTTRGAPMQLSRTEAGLPERGFVFCTFNNAYKFTPQMFDIWMRLLAQVEGSLLWMYAENPIARTNLRAEAQARGVPQQRLVFAARVDHETQLARIGVADLFLDTLPCNAHTTASDALWAGLPLITCSGQGFAARVAGSLLHAVGLPELVTTDLAAYEALALELARAPQRLAGIREKLRSNRAASPLFDTARLCRALERAYQTMWDIHLTGEKPRGFKVAKNL